MSRPSGPGEEGGCGLVVADLGVEGVAVGGGDVGRVGDDGVEGLRLPRERLSRSDSRKRMRAVRLWRAAFSRARSRAAGEMSSR
jgi:hypothetical protein